MNSVDFLPERIKIKRARYRRLVRQAHLLVVCAFALVVLGYLRSETIRDTRIELKLIGEQTESVKLQLAQRSGLERERAKFLIFQRVEEQLGSRVNALNLLSELEHQLPQTVALLKVNVATVDVPRKLRPATKGGQAMAARSVGGLQHPEVMVKRLQVVLTGLAPDDVSVATFIGQLSSSRMFEDVNMGYSVGKEIPSETRYGKVKAREFQASCYVAR